MLLRIERLLKNKGIVTSRVAERGMYPLPLQNIELYVRKKADWENAIDIIGADPQTYDALEDIIFLDKPAKVR